MMTLTLLLVLAAFVTVILSLMGKCPIAVPVLCLVMIEALRAIPR